MAQPRKRQLNLFDRSSALDTLSLYAARRIREMRSEGDVRPLRLLILDVQLEIEDAIRGIDSANEILHLPTH